MLIGPAFDINEGKLRLVVQLLNKRRGLEVDELDCAQLEALLPAIAEVLKAADDTMRVVAIAAGLSGHMEEMKASVAAKAGSFMAESTTPMIGTSVRYMGDMIRMMAQNKKRSVFADPGIMQEVFKEIKEASRYY